MRKKINFEEEITELTNSLNIFLKRCASLETEKIPSLMEENELLESILVKILKDKQINLNQQNFNQTEWKKIAEIKDKHIPEEENKDDQPHSEEQIEKQVQQMEEEKKIVINQSFTEEDTDEEMGGKDELKVEKYVNNLIDEILNTERMYVKNLDVLIEFYLNPLKEISEKNIFEKRKMIKRDQFSSFYYGNLVSIRSLNKSFLEYKKKKNSSQNFNFLTKKGS